MNALLNPSSELRRELRKFAQAKVWEHIEPNIRHVESPDDISTILYETYYFSETDYVWICEIYVTTPKFARNILLVVNNHWHVDFVEELDFPSQNHLSIAGIRISATGKSLFYNIRVDPNYFNPTGRYKSSYDVKRQYRFASRTMYEFNSKTTEWVRIQRVTF